MPHKTCGALSENKMQFNIKQIEAAAIELAKKKDHVDDVFYRQINVGYSILPYDDNMVQGTYFDERTQEYFKFSCGVSMADAIAHLHFLNKPCSPVAWKRFEENGGHDLEGPLKNNL